MLQDLKETKFSHRLLLVLTGETEGRVAARVGLVCLLLPAMFTREDETRSGAASVVLVVKEAAKPYQLRSLLFPSMVLEFFYTVP